MFVCAGSSKSSAERYAVSYRSFDSHDSEEVESFLWETLFSHRFDFLLLTKKCFQGGVGILGAGGGGVHGVDAGGEGG